jgi:hypothetical protein
MNDKHAKIIERIKKLLALATSSNQNEAEIAAKMAYDLLARHNISMASVDREKHFTEEMAGKASKAMQCEELAVAEIVSNFFHVRGIFGRRRVSMEIKLDVRSVWVSQISYVGEAHNVEIACYVHDFLLRSFKECWKAYSMANLSKGRGVKKSYILGLKTGLARKLMEQRSNMEQKEGLVLVEDSDLDKFMKEKDLKKKRSEKDVDNGEAYRQGMVDGNMITIAAGVESKRQTPQVGQTLKLGGSL